MARIGFRVGTYIPKNNLTGIDRVAKNIIERELQFAPENEYILLEKNRFGLRIPVDRVVAAAESSQMVSLQVWRNNVELVHSFFDPCTNFGGEVKAAKVLTIHDLIDILHPEWYGNPDSREKTERLRRAICGADRILTVSFHTKKDVINLFGTDEQKIEVVYSGLDSGLQKTGYSGDITRAKYHLNQDYILSVCTLEPRKNLVGLVRAFEAYKSRVKDSDVQLVIVGSTGWLTDAIFDSVRSSSFKEDIILTGYVSDAELLSLYKNCLFAAYVSFYEGFGLPVLEALTLGKTVLCSNTSSLPEVGGAAVCYCDPHDTASIAEGLGRLCEDDVYRKALESRAALQAGKFSYDQAAKQCLAVYQELLAE